MLSQALLRLASAVSRRRMKLLLGIALLAYVACECAGYSFPPAAYSLPPSVSPSRSARAAAVRTGGADPRPGCPAARGAAGSGSRACRVAGLD
ncbi:hypothetical protein J1605_005652 [Eschrichtius robustus]|uniref:Uncharacterized protein n=1 Tax=Eschrichtius robustus TaxID=9764 RepID=A0AB34H6I2_ESCRO|nr:hypothetical protein J1605_005652 [Eschrichtius robustus]